jgi:hypothetical protein
VEADASALLEMLDLKEPCLRNGAIEILEKDGYSVRAVANSLRGVMSDAQ